MDERSGGNDRLMTFRSPSSVRTDLPQGTDRTDVLIFYASDIEPSSLRARLNGQDASAWFHPYKGWREVVRVPLAPGDNRLDLAIKGVVNRQRRTEHVRLTFTVAK
jgi:hypothetical protein